MKNWTIICALMIYMPFFAQQNVVSSGGDGVGAGGSFSFTLGQIDYTHVNSINGEMNQGIQQPLESTLNLDKHSNELGIFFYPNPVRQYITIINPNDNLNIFKVVITDFMGKFIESHSMNSKKCTLNLGDLSAGTYFITIYRDSDSFTNELLIKL